MSKYCIFLGAFMCLMFLDIKMDNSNKVNYYMTSTATASGVPCYDCNGPSTETCLIINGIKYEGVKEKVDCPPDEK